MNRGENKFLCVVLKNKKFSNFFFGGGGSKFQKRELYVKSLNEKKQQKIETQKCLYFIFPSLRQNYLSHSSTLSQFSFSSTSSNATEKLSKDKLYNYFSHYEKNTDKIGGGMKMDMNLGYDEIEEILKKKELKKRRGYIVKGFLFFFLCAFGGIGYAAVEIDRNKYYREWIERRFPMMISLSYERILPFLSYIHIYVPLNSFSSLSSSDILNNIKNNQNTKNNDKDSSFSSSSSSSTSISPPDINFSSSANDTPPSPSFSPYNKEACVLNSLSSSSSLPSHSSSASSQSFIAELEEGAGNNEEIDEKEAKEKEEKEREKNRNHVEISSSSSKINHVGNKYFAEENQQKNEENTEEQKDILTNESSSSAEDKKDDDNLIVKNKQKVENEENEKKNSSSAFLPSTIFMDEKMNDDCMEKDEIIDSPESSIENAEKLYLSIPAEDFAEEELNKCLEMNEEELRQKIKDLSKQICIQKKKKCNQFG